MNDAAYFLQRKFLSSSRANYLMLREISELIKAHDISNILSRILSRC